MLFHCTSKIFIVFVPPDETSAHIIYRPWSQDTFFYFRHYHQDARIISYLILANSLQNLLTSMRSLLAPSSYVNGRNRGTQRCAYFIYFWVLVCFFVFWDYYTLTFPQADQDIIGALYQNMAFEVRWNFWSFKGFCASWRLTLVSRSSKNNDTFALSSYKLQRKILSFRKSLSDYGSSWFSTLINLPLNQFLSYDKNYSQLACRQLEQWDDAS